jgi:hypothetical protein
MYHNLSLSLALSLIVLGPVRAEPRQALLDPTDLGVPFQRYTTKDALDRKITFYVSMANAENTKARLPIVLFIQGSGCRSIFPRKGDRPNAGIPGLLLEEANGMVRVLVVEKPGVNWLDQPKRPGSVERASAECGRITCHVDIAGRGTQSYSGHGPLGRGTRCCPRRHQVTTGDPRGQPCLRGTDPTVQSGGITRSSSPGRWPRGCRRTPPGCIRRVGANPG